MTKPTKLDEAVAILPAVWRSESPDYPGEQRWCLSFDNGARMVEVELFDDGSCEWFALDRNERGSGRGDTVLDPFSGAGTTGLVALRHDRHYIGIEINPEYAQMSRERIDRERAAGYQEALL